MRWRDAVDPVHALGQGVLSRIIVGGKVIDKAHDACSACAALPAGNRHLRCKTPAG